VALVTGGASGLGLATVRELHARGAQVVIANLPSSQGDSVAKELGDGVVFAPADVTGEAEVAAAVDAARSLGPLRIVVNCAGIGNAIKTVGKHGAFPLIEFTKVVNVNLIGTFNAIRLAAERMAQASPVGEERGVIINTASVAAFDGQIGQAAYSASKGGIAAQPQAIRRAPQRDRERAHRHHRDRHPPGHLHPEAAGRDRPRHPGHVPVGRALVPTPGPYRD
jgi:NAD(P)-dependent dehydrogenase (short-subunit alcohol dehydrogenase family)